MNLQPPQEPLYGTIPALGKQWTVCFRATANATKTLSGYGEFPRTEYPDIPVIDYRSGDVIAASRLPYVEESSLWISGCEYTPLADFLRRAANYGLLVWENGIYTPVKPSRTETRDDQEPDSDGWYTVTRTYRTFTCPECGVEHEFPTIAHGDGFGCPCGARLAADLY